MLQKCAKNAQVQNNPSLKWGTCHISKYMVVSKINCYPKSSRPQQHPNQNQDKLWATYIILGRGWDPISHFVS